MASLVLALRRLSIAPGTLAVYSGVAEEGTSASVRLCGSRALAEVSLGSVLAALGYRAPSPQWRQRSRSSAWSALPHPGSLETPPRSSRQATVSAFPCGFLPSLLAPQVDSLPPVFC